MAHPLSSEEPIAIGQETIIPIYYPKFSLGGDYNVGRKFHGFRDEKLREKLGNEISTSLSFEAGLLKYFNAGALIGFNVPNFKLLEPLHVRLALFGKPFIGLGERVSLFSRMGVGIGWALCLPGMKRYLEMEGSSMIKEELKRVYEDGTYNFLGLGLNTLLTAGIEYFPWSRVGFAFEGGIRAEFLTAKKTKPLLGGEISATAPKWFNYMIYEFPLGLMVHIIL